MKEFFLYSYFVILAILSVFGFHRYYSIHVYRKYRNKVIKPKSTFGKLPKVTIQLPVFNEKYVVQRLIEKVSQIRYPSELLEIQVLDDSTDDTVDICKKKVNEVAKRGVNIKYIHRTDRTGYKAGALEAGQKVAEGDFIAVFDADFLPPPEFLEETVHFFTDEKVGMVQARWDHINRNYSILTEAQSILLDGHFMIEHTARNRSGRFFNFNGTAGIWRKKTIGDAGGWQHDTLTEDLDLSYRAQLKGWNFVYLKDLTVPAELPIEMSSFKSQQFRWAKGSIQVFLKLFRTLMKSNVSWKVKVESFFHLGANFAYLLMMVLSMLMPINIMLRYRQGWQEIFMFDLPIFLMATLSIMIFYFYTEVIVINETLSVKHRSKISPIYFLPFTISLGIGLSVNNCRAVIEALFKKETPFIRTPKYNVGEKEKGGNKRESLSHIISNSYRIKKINWVSMVEFFLAIYFTYAVYFAFYSKLYLSIPFLMLFQLGFIYTSFLSIFYTPIMTFLRKKA
jgi:cellulose synthase/poly-beta-1,6-N-acetylglucosamine synthase-like glycosyltransferase